MDDVSLWQPFTLFGIYSASDTNAITAGLTDITDYCLRQAGAARDALIAYSGGNFQILESVPIINVSDDNPPNQAYYANNVPLFAFQLDGQMLVGGNY